MQGDTQGRRSSPTVGRRKSKMETGPPRSSGPGATQQGEHEHVYKAYGADLYDTKPRTEESIQRAEKRLMKRQEERKRRLEEVGIKYDFDAVAYVGGVLLAFPQRQLINERQKKKPKSS